MELQRPMLPQMVQSTQVICFALATGPIVFGLVVHFVIGPGEQEGNLLQMLGLGLGALALLLSPFFGGLFGFNVARQAGADASDEELAGAYQVGFIVSSAINEGAAFVNIIAYMLEGSIWSLATAAILVGANLLKFPTLASVEAWIAMKRRSLRDEADLSG